MKLVAYLQQHHGIARRVLTGLIQNREIILNGIVVEDFLMQVQEGDHYIITSFAISGTVTISTTDHSQIVMFYKPVGYTVSKSDPHNDTIFDIVPSDWKRRYYPIGRLDKDSCGLLLLTDNPQRVNQLSHPRYQHTKIYHVLLSQPRQAKDTPKVLNGVTMMDPKSNQEVTFACDSIMPITGGVAITLHEGKNRHIRNMLGSLGYDITQLKRVQYCGLHLNDMVSGEYRIYQYTSLDQLSVSHPK